MKKTVALFLALILALGCMSVTVFAADEGKDGTVDITAEVPEKVLYYEMVIPSAVKMTEADVKEIGAPSVTGVENAKDDTVISYTAVGTDFKCEGKSDMPASYYTDSEGTTAMPETAIEVYKSKALVNPLTTLYVGVTETDWNAADAGTYTATVTFHFSAERVAGKTELSDLIANMENKPGSGSKWGDTVEGNAYLWFEEDGLHVNNGLLGQYSACIPLTTAFAPSENGAKYTASYDTGTFGTLTITLNLADSKVTSIEVAGAEGEAATINRTYTA